MLFYVDSHIHSKYSRATSRDLDLETLSLWANKKGITVVGTGDFTHPVWFAEIKEKLVPAEPGLLRLKPEIEAHIAKQIKNYTPTRFILSVEISTIYKKNEKTRKVHHMVYAKDLHAVEKIRTALDKIGNIKSDGRPILGLDSRHLLEIVLQASTDNYLIPAHIWTPWFSVLGSKSGFDSIAECYADLSPHIFAVETGLSSDPEMNWRVSSLDKYRLVSNSDAHSPAKLGREATLFDTAIDYFAIKTALMTGNGYVGTVEFYPEEGKYHLDGHRKCNLSLEPEDTIKYNGICPICGGKITVGVLHRVNELADKKDKIITPPATAGKVISLIPLAEILAEIHQKGVSSKAVQQDYETLITKFGSEFDILTTINLSELEKQHSDIFREAITRLRQAKVIRTAGYDGEYGIIKLFTPGELQHKSSRNMILFDLPDITPAAKSKKLKTPDAPTQKNSATTQTIIPKKSKATFILDDLDEQQKIAAKIIIGPLVIVAGPGSGKTRTLTYRIAYMVKEKNINPAAILALTFTRRAAKEMQQRLEQLLQQNYQQIAMHTFHSFCFTILKENFAQAGIAKDYKIATELQQIELIKTALHLTATQAKKWLREIAQLKCEQNFNDAKLKQYQQLLQINHLLDFDDLLNLTIQLFTSHPDILNYYRQQFAYISIDEYQDIDNLQYQLIKLLAPAGSNLCVIGDPKQAIYKFRGGSAEYFNNFTKDYPGAASIQLTHNYRSTATIVNASNQVIADHSSIAIKQDGGDKITIHVAKTAKAEAEFIVKTIENLIGGHNFFSIDSGRTQAGESNFSFADFAILYRTKIQAELLSEALNRSGMPFINYSTDYLGNNPIVGLILENLVQNPHKLALKQQLEQFNLTEFLSNHTDTIEAKNKLEQLKALAKLVDYDHESFLNELSLAKETDTIDARSESIALMTLHAAKGLEFKIVFMPGLEDGIIPLYFGSKSNADLIEEQRLFYVGMTRAQEKLYLTRAEQRCINGKLKQQQSSAFLDQIEARLTELTKTENKKKAATDKQLSLW